MKYDFHVHTTHYSPCALEEPETICRKALKAGLRGIALTEHDTWWPRRELDILSRKFPGLTIFRGVEYTCPEGHFLVFLPEKEERSFERKNGVLTLIEQVHNRGGLVIWAHPFRFGEDPSGWLGAADLDGLEVASSNMNNQTRRLARSIASQRNFRMFENSDTHQESTLGMFFNNIPFHLTNTDQLIHFMRNPGLSKRVS
jgi:predicted metal-dependent phosphoesterase TrpH